MSQISNLPSAGALTGEEFVPIAQQHGIVFNTVKTNLRNLFNSGISAAAYVVPVSGDILTASFKQAAYQLEPAAELMGLTLVLPPSPSGDDEFWIATTASITNLVASAAGGPAMAAGSAGPMNLGAGGRLTWKYLAAQNKWYGQF